MVDPQRIMERYVALWNEPDPGLRRKAIAELWAVGGRHVLTPSQEARKAAGDMAMTAVFESRGHDELEARVTNAYEQFIASGEYTFRARGAAARLENVVTFGWEAVTVNGGEVAGGGLEFLILDDEGRIETDYQFIET